MFNFTKFFYQMTFEQKNIFLKVTRKIDLSWKKNTEHDEIYKFQFLFQILEEKKKQLNK